MDRHLRLALWLCVVTLSLQGVVSLARGDASTAIPISLNGLPLAPESGAQNQWIEGQTLCRSSGDGLPTIALEGRSFHGTVRLQTTSVQQGPDRPGPALAGGVLRLDLQWTFIAGGSPVSVLQTGVAEFALGADGPQDLSVDLTGSVPDAPFTPGGIQTTNLYSVNLLVNGASTAQGQGVTCMWLCVD